uniref:ATP synthase protein 8 n=1 Tax=Lumbricus terrestris TaxID=6398 RepID=ATP8_LUMTE|nr:ATP synthase F0 subunit 8 [Lumbricus terrestris]Q34942.1 RecName: Full=ATP synthase protein 8; AltName: Full=A6L; AltName: Full=F-ATPase subunit 8 [Lumbricus terrestris]AAC46866.1 ATP synthase subunit 8 [Lumbricus terrestris]prf//2122275C ATPase:SUBUNIT=8 [Lumbricus terrestris]
MPHLSPMSWITSMLMFWISVSILFSTLWWSNNYLFSSKMTNCAPKSLTPWNWL